MNGFSGSVTVTAAGLPSGVTVSPSSLLVSAITPGSLSFVAGANVAAGNAQISIIGVSGTQQASAMLGMNVIQSATPVAMPFTTTGGGIVKAFYDESRQRLFASNLFLNEVDVLSGQNLSIQARIPIPQPFGIDQMPDGNTLVVGTFTQGFYTINEGTLAVSQYLSPNFSQFSTTVLGTPVAMANGKVLFMATDFGMGATLYGGDYIVEWDSTTGIFTVPTWFTIGSGVVDVKRSADRNWAVVAGGVLYIYSSATDTAISSIAPVNSAPFGVRDIGVNQNGTQFAVVSAYSVSFYDGSFNALGTVNLGSAAALVFDNSTSQYSADGTRFYWEMLGDQGGGSVIDVLDTAAFTELGSVTTDYGDQTQFSPIFLWMDSQQRGFFSALGGVGVLDCSSLRQGPPTVNGGLYPTPSGIPLNQTASVTLTITNYTLPTGTSVTIGGQLAPLQSTNPMVVQVPASSVAGPVNLVLTQPDGESLIEPQFFSYGVDVLAATSTLIPPIGSPIIGLFGFGMLNGPSTAPAVSVGPQNIANVSVIVDPDPNNMLQELSFHLPSGSLGSPDIVVTGNNGSGTLAGTLTYIPSAKIIPASGLLQLLYDPHRNLLYALQSTEVQVFNPVTLQWQAPLKPGANGGMGYVSLAITPDGTQLLALDAKASALTVFNPDNPSQSITTPLSISLPGFALQSVAATSTGKAFIAGPPLEFDLATNTYTLLQNDSIAAVSKLVATPGGSYMVGVNELSTAGTIATWDSGNDSFATQGFFGIIWTDVAISPDGSFVAALAGNVSEAGVAAAFFDENLHYINATVYPDLAPPDQPFSTGAIFSASGQTLLTPLADSIDFFNTHTATLQGRLLMPESLPVGDASAGTIALDPNQETIYAISSSGLTVVTLPSTVDEITPPLWPDIAPRSHSASFAVRAQRGHVPALPK
jgi:hypothetical protein